MDIALEIPSVIGEDDNNLTFGSKVLCRRHQIQTLTSLFGQSQHMTPGSLFIYGHTGTGKTLTIQALMKHYKLPHILMNCIECSSPRVLFEHILNNIPADSAINDNASEVDSDTDMDDDTYVTCDDMTDFVRQLTQTVAGSSLGRQTLYIVFDKAERLRDSHTFMLPALLRLQELTKLNICTVFISEIVWEKFRFGTGFYEPYCLHFPDYSRHELQEILSLDCPPPCPSELYSLYINIVLSVFHCVCRDLREMRHLARLNFPYFIDPVTSGEVEASQTRKLWRNIEPHLKRALKSVYLREVSSQQWEKLQQAEIEDPEAEYTVSSTTRCQVELPYYSKFLLIAAYLASYNPMKYDRRFFAKNAGKTSRRSKLIKKNERASNHLLGPKVFPIDRLMAIFYSIVEGKVVPSANIYIQISSLVSLHLLSQQKGEDRIATPRYKCLVTLDFIRSIARTVQFDIMRYLYDFL